MWAAIIAIVLPFYATTMLLLSPSSNVAESLKLSWPISLITFAYCTWLLLNWNLRNVFLRYRGTLATLCVVLEVCSLSSNSTARFENNIVGTIAVLMIAVYIATKEARLNDDETKAG
jgi:hypothetical protein